ncbi:MAG: regulatory iron-sulfur-containing complex subunit RicT [Planctomycetota bacterium]|nr:regulatory iron-sulfur-containing complex subunit RicT [Planctomycetota bacterium]
MPITPLPQFEADLQEYRDQIAEKAAADAAEQKTLVVRFGAMKLIGEYRYDGKVKPGCGSKVVARTHRGTELGELLTVTCKNGACAKSITRKEMLGYIDMSGGRDYPFFTKGKVLRIATTEDMHAQEGIEQSRHELVRKARDAVAAAGSSIRVVDAEPILGGELMTYYFLSEERVDARDAHRALSALHNCRVEFRQVGARDEARLTADYERCGQHCCCKNFLKVLKPVSMRSAKVQKATLEPLKISGRCGRLMCCLRYEDETYEELRKRLPHRKSRVGTPHGDGMVLSSQILTQLVLVRLDIGENAAVPVENLTPPISKTPPPPPEPGTHFRRESRPPQTKQRRERTRADSTAAPTDQPATKKKRRRRKKKKPQGTGTPGSQTSTGTRPPQPSKPSGERTTGNRPADTGAAGGPPPQGTAQPPQAKKKRRRRRRKKPGGGERESGSGPSNPSNPSPPNTPSGPSA